MLAKPQACKNNLYFSVVYASNIKFKNLLNLCQHQPRYILVTFFDKTQKMWLWWHQ